MIRIVFFGTSAPSAAILETLYNTEGFKIVGVITQPDRPIGRKHVLTPPPVKIFAQKNSIPVWQPESLKNFSVNTLPPADLFFVFSFGQILPKNLLALPTHGTINLHPSLLPKYRGPTPIQSALLNGETTTGYSVMLLDEQMDHGPILYAEEININPNDNTDTLTERILSLAAQKLPQIIKNWVQNNITAVEQKHDQATFCKLLTKEAGKVDWQNTATNIYNQFRAYSPWPGLWTNWKGLRLKLLSILPSADAAPAGQVVLKNDTLLIGCKDGAVAVSQLQLEGDKALEYKSFLAGHGDFVGGHLN